MHRLKLHILFYVTLVAPHFLQDFTNPRLFVVWNVGQGQWLTWVQGSKCFHFDMGGEKMNWGALHKICGHRYNEVYFTHGDKDHLNFWPKAKRRLPHLCLRTPPRQQNLALPKCIKPTSKEVTVLDPLLYIKNKSLKLNSNDKSFVFLVARKILIPGDSTKKIEKIWSPVLNLNPVKLLVAGHHGSNTSSHKTLLRNLPQLIGAVASSRKSKYGHPHPKVTYRLMQKNVPLISTESWGSLAFRWL